MPRVSRAETERNRIAIEEAASRLIRERGLSVSVADLMGAAGMTHGGFYGHFESKDALNAVACANAFEGALERWKRRTAKAKDKETARIALVEGYLTNRNRAEPGATCPMAALVVDVAREDENKPVRAAFIDGIEQLVDILASVQPPTLNDQERQASALAQMATMVGAMVLARATHGSPMSDDVLAAARQYLLQTAATATESRTGDERLR
jgi:TetR/AcrR family transcriptional repressor of nem operon